MDKKSNKRIRFNFDAPGLTELDKHSSTGRRTVFQEQEKYYELSIILDDGTKKLYKVLDNGFIIEAGL